MLFLFAYCWITRPLISFICRSQQIHILGQKSSDKNILASQIIIYSEIFFGTSRFVIKITGCSTSRLIIIKNRYLIYLLLTWQSAYRCENLTCYHSVIFTYENKSLHWHSNVDKWNVSGKSIVLLPLDM